jgi:signal transduction histidine kinase/ActR/RegA family two-component response regulator
MSDLRGSPIHLLIHTPFRGDAASLMKLLGPHYPACVCNDLKEVAAGLGETTGLVVLTEEALLDGAGVLAHAFASQPPWSDIPVILLASKPNRSGRDAHLARLRLPESVINVVVLERPLSSASLLSSVGAAWRSRTRQFEMRERMAELAEERGRFKVLLENIPVGVCFMDRDGRTLVSNPLYDHYVPNRVIPSRRPETVARWVALDASGNVLSPELFPGARALQGEAVKGIDFCHSRPGDDDAWMRVSAVPLYDEASDIIGAASVILDITEEKTSELALRRFNEELEIQVRARTAALAQAINELKAESAERQKAEEQLRQSMKMEAVGQLTGGIAHDFNNMLTGVTSALDLIKLRIAKGQMEGLDRYMAAAQTSAQRAAALTQRLLAFSRRQSLDTRVLAVNELILSLHDLLSRTVTEQIELVLDLNPVALWLLADVNQLENAILNLVINARDAMHKKSGAITVSTRPVSVTGNGELPHGLTDGDYVRIEVRDTGSGIPARVLDKVFDPFFTTKPQGQGTGLGLSMVYGFARQSQGQVHIASVEGEGTTVSIFLPATDGEVQQEPASAQPATSAGQGQVILLVEDEESVRLLNRELLIELGYEVYCAEDGQQALSLLQRMPRPDLLVTDVGLPGMNGRQLAEVVQQLLPRLPVLFLTAYASEASNRTRFLGERMNLLTKPFALEELANTIRQILDESASQQLAEPNA